MSQRRPKNTEFYLLQLQHSICCNTEFYLLEGGNLNLVGALQVYHWSSQLAPSVFSVPNFQL